MTEGEWLSCSDTRPMLRFLLGTSHPRIQDHESFPDCKTSNRKLRLFACACYHRIRHLLPDPRARLAVEIAEKIADGILPEEERQKAELMIREPQIAMEGRWRASRDEERNSLLPTHEALALAGVILWDQAQKAAYYAASNASWTIAAIANPGASLAEGKFGTSEKAEELAQTDLLRCIFGPLPFRLNSLAGTVRHSGTIPKLAQAIYEDRAFDGLPVLADALEEAGCDNEEILAHFRGPGPHVRGCWALDLVLGKK